MELIRLNTAGGQTHAQVAATLGYSRAWARKWVRRYRREGVRALQPPPARSPHPLARFAPAVAEAARTCRRTYPRLGARRVLLALETDPALEGLPLPDARTLHRFFVAERLVARSLPRDERPDPEPVAAPADPHAVWQIDHPDHLALAGVEGLSVLQSIRAPAAGLTVGADLFAGPRGAHGVSVDELCDGLRRHLARWGRPRAVPVDHAALFLGQPQRQFPSRFELFCAGLDIAVVPIRPGRPTDNAEVERPHQTLDGVVLGPPFPGGRPPAQQELDAHVEALNTRFPSRAAACRGKPPLVAFPHAGHSGRPYDPRQEWGTFDLAAADRHLAQWRWYRQVGQKTGQISFADVNRPVGKAHRGQVVTLRFDPTDRRVVIDELGPTPTDPGPEIRRFPCAAFDKATILGTSQVAPRPADPTEDTLQ